MAPRAPQTVSHLHTVHTGMHTEDVDADSAHITAAIVYKALELAIDAGASRGQK